MEAEYLKKAEECGIDQVYAKPFPVGELALILQDLNFINEIPSHIHQECEDY